MSRFAVYIIVAVIALWALDFFLYMKLLDNIEYRKKHVHDKLPRPASPP